MAFFDDAKRNLNQASQSAVKKTKDMSEIAKLNSSNLEYEDKIRELYSKIGYESYRAYHEGQPIEVTSLLEEVESMYLAIEVNKNRINEINAANLCPNCGAKITKKNAFCGQCGYQFPKPPKQVQRFCSKCGSSLAPGTAFCSNCGNKIN